MPWAAWMSYRKIKSGRPLAPKVKRFRAAIALLLLTGLISFNAAKTNAVELPFHIEYWSLLYGAVVIVALVNAVTRGRHRQPPGHRERIRLLYAPTSGVELAWSMVGGICAGIFEEIAYRAVLYELLGRVMGYGSSLIVCVILFVVAHMPQGVRGGIGVAILAIMFHITYVLSGSLLAPILIHTVYDLCLFAILYRDERKQTLSVQPVEQPA